MVIGNGQLGLEDEHAKSLLPLLVFATEEEIDRFWQLSFNRKFKDYLNSPDAVGQIKNALLTVEIGLLSEHQAYLSDLARVPADRQEAWKVERQRLHQSNTRDLRKRAHETGKLLTKKET